MKQQDEREHFGLVPPVVRHNGGYAESTLSERRFPICGYLASSLRKLRRARDGRQFGKQAGCCARRDQYFILWAIKISRTSGRACIRFSSAESPVPAVRNMTREPFSQ